MRRPLSCVVACVALCACGEHDVADDATDPLRSSTIARVASAQQALEGAQIATVDPQTMNQAEIFKALGRGSYCAFRYTSSGRPVLAVQYRAEQSRADGLVKLNGHLVTLQRQASSYPLSMRAGDVQLQMTFPDATDDLRERAAEMREADLLFIIDHRLRVGYRGYYGCTA